MPVPATPVMIDCIDTYYAYIVAQAAQLNPAQAFTGVLAAQDWPQTEANVTGGLGLLYLGGTPDVRRSTQSQQFIEHSLQWVWILMGADIAANEVAANRGSRYLMDMGIRELLRQAHFPGFCPKQFLTLNNSTGAVSFTTYSPIETITWSNPKMRVAPDNGKSGILYGSATVQLFGWSDVNPLVNP